MMRFAVSGIQLGLGVSFETIEVEVVPGWKKHSSVSTLKRSMH